MNRLLSTATHAVIAATLLIPAGVCANDINWMGGSSLNWSDPANWDGPLPGSQDTVYLTDLIYSGYTNAPGVVNNTVDSSVTVGAIQFTATSSTTIGRHFFTTLIPSGSVLTVGGGITEPAFRVGLGSSGAATNYTSFTGPGSLVVNNPSSRIDIQQVSKATLDLSGLNNFTANISNLWIGASATVASPIGALLLAQTNTLTTAPNPTGPGILIGRTFSSTAIGILTLGQVNTFNTDGLVVGGTRSGSGVGNNRLGFSPGASNPTFTLRGSAGGSSRAAIFSIGDISAEDYDYLTPLGGNANGSVDFSGGIVDIKADSIYVARSCADVGSGGNFTTATGSLIVESGNVDANNVFIAYKQGTNGSYANPSSLTLKSNAFMIVNHNLSLAFRNNVTNGPVAPNGTLSVNDSASLNVGGDITHGDGGISTLSLGGGTINMTGGGNVYAYGLSGFGTIAGANNITVTNNLTVGPATTAGTLTLGGNLTLANPFPIVFDLGPTNTPGSGVNDFLNVTGNVSFNNNPVSFTYGGPLLTGSNYTIIAFTGSRSGLLTYNNDTRSQLGLDQTTPGQVNLVVTNWTPATLVWQGTTANSTNLWSTANNLYWTNTAAGADRFFQGDAVVFDDTAINATIYPNGQLYPASILINCNSKNIVITNRSQAGPYSGVIGGGCSITKNGTGTVTFGTYSNTFTGQINVNNGVWKLFDPNFLSPADRPTLGSINSPMYINSGATLDFFGVGQTATGKPLIIAGNGFNGQGVITNSSTSGSVNGFAVTLAADSTISADISAVGLKTTVPNVTTAPPFSGLLNLNGFTLTKLGVNRFSLQDVMATNSGNLNIVSGNLAIANCIIDGPGSLNLSNGTFLAFGIGGTLSTSGYVGKPINAYNVGLVANIGNTPAPAIINSTVNLLGTLSLTNTQPIVMNGAISGTSGIAKFGTSNLVLNAVNTYTGPTIVNAGGLAIGASGSIANTPLIQINPGTLLDVTAKPSGLALAPGQTLNFNGSALGNLTVGAGSTFLGSGVIAGSLTVSPGAEVAPATTNVTGTIIVSNNVILAGGHFTWEMAPSFDISDAIIVGGNLTLTGTNTFTVNSIGGFDPSGTNTLITYTGTLTGGLANLAVNSSARFAVEFVDPALTPGAIKIRLVTPSPNIVWTGTNTARPTFWDVKTTTNWNNGGTPDIFWSSDAVTFDDTAGTNIVDLIGTLGPASVEMANNSAPYLFRGAGALVTSSVTNDGVGFVISNTANNFFTGAGLVLNSGTVTFSQPTNVSLTANLIGSGKFNKAGISNLTLIGNSASFFGPFNITAGTLRAGSSNVLGSGNATVSSGATLDVNGQILTSAASISVGGAGADGFGAINNRGAGRTNAVGMVTLTANTIFGALSNAWGIVNGLTGGGFSLTKTNANDVWVMTGGDTDLGNLIVNQGRLVFAATGTTLGRSDSNAIVFPNATLAFAATNAMPQSGPPPSGFDAGSKPIVLQGNAILESIGFPFNLTSTNIFSGPISITNNAHFRVGGNSQLMLNGPISGTNGQLILTNGGTLILTGTNTYTSNTLVYSGTLLLTNAASLPTNTVLVLSNNIATGNPSLLFANGPVFPTNNTMRFTAVNGITSIGGDGTWTGPIFMYGSNTFQISGGPNLLNLVGPLITNNAGGAGSLQFHGSNTRVVGSLRYSGSVTFGVGDGLAAGFDERFTTVRFDNTNNWTSVANFERGRIIIGTNNALPPGAPFNSINGLSLGISDRRVIFDLNGYNQTFSSITEVAAGNINGLNLIGNSSTNSDSTITYAGTGTNTWGIQLVDTLDTPEIPHKLGLTVTSGFLELLNTNTYTGPTLVTGGKLLVAFVIPNTISTFAGSLDATPVTVNGTGTFGGNGTVAGNVTIGAGGTLVPGDSFSFLGAVGTRPLTRIGQLTLMGTDLTFASGSRAIIEVDLGAGTNDMVVGIGTLNYGGSLVISNLGAQPFTNGTVLKLFDAATYVSGAVAIQPTSPAPGLMWDTSTLAVDGTLRVTTTIPPTLANAMRQPDGNMTFQINGALGQGYSVRSTTNIALPLANWTILQSGTITTTPYVFSDLNATNYPLRFYGVSSP
jgi:autotransporter-associated beta strand protein